jgi:glucose-6-phosphate 1-dehydrogenase
MASASAKNNSCLINIFGASGDLTKRKLIPALYYNYITGQMPEKFAVMGISRTKYSDEQFRQYLWDFAEQTGKKYDPEQWAKFSKHVHYLAADSTKNEDYPLIKQRMAELRDEHQICENVIFYLSMAPHLYEPTINLIGQNGMVTEGKAWCSLDQKNRSWQRIIIEKPFGHDPESAAHLNRVVGRVFEEESIYRIDHYMGKETVQNLMVFRFANTIFEPVWNRNYIDHVQITAAETVGVETRGDYYDSDSGGAMRDMIQSHLLQLMAVVAMEPPVSLKADDVRNEKLKVLAATRTPTADEIPFIAVRGQYGPGQINGKPVPGYREEKGVATDSQTDTYAAIELAVDTWRWGGVPFYLRSGKRMSKKMTEIVIYFKPTPHILFSDRFGSKDGNAPNQIVINVQPDEGIRLRFEGKVPGQGMNIKSVVMDFDYIAQFKAEPPEAYATLLLDCIRGDQTLFKNRFEIEHAWRIVQPVLDYWKANPDPSLPNYAAGCDGPAAAEEMLARNGRHWRKT